MGFVVLKSILALPGGLSLLLALYAGVLIRSTKSISSVRWTVEKNENGRPCERSSQSALGNTTF